MRSRGTRCFALTLVLTAVLSQAVDVKVFHDIGQGFVPAGHVVPDASDGQVRASLLFKGFLRIWS
jgi:hypothetical protein